MKFTLLYSFINLQKTIIYLGLFIGLCAINLPTVLAHDIPSRATLFIYVKPEQDQLNVLVRAPMDTLSEIDFPRRGPGYLNFALLGESLEDATHVYILSAFKILEDNQPLPEPEIFASRVSLPNDRSFVSYSTASENFSQAQLTDTTDLYWKQAFMDVWLKYPIQSPQSDFAIDSNLDRLGVQTTTVMRFVLPSGGERIFNYLGNPGRVELDPSLFQAIWRFVVLGFEHILDGMDHLLFLFCLVIPLRRVRALIPVITAFTVAHSITLISSAFGLVPNVLWFGPLIETLIAVSIVYMAFENIFFANKVGADLKNRWLVTFGFGLVHGFGFSFVLAETMQFAGGHLFTSLLAFNLGVEAGQLLVLLLVVPVLVLLFKWIKQEKIGVILLSALVAHTAWHWMLERGDAFLQYQLQWPVLDLLFFVGLLRWVMLLVVVVGAMWLMFNFAKRFQTAKMESPVTSFQSPD